MYFKRIDMQGFKSFADRVSIEFHSGITCIVGPNGSGKSNISDAIRWVLGEQSPKMLRGGKMEEVIFAGTANRKSRGMAEVTLVIDNAAGILPIDYSEVAITRRMYRSGESEYSINQNQCRLRDIRELIMDTGIGVDGYSLIGQGKIAEMVSSKAESRREIFEEAAGIVKYRSKKAESERKLEASKGNLDRVEDIVSEIESRIDGLRSDSEKAQEYLVLKEKYQELEINITLKNIENVELKNEYLKDDITEAKNKIDECKDEKGEIDGQAAEYRERVLELERLAEETRSRAAICTTEINDLVNNEQLNGERLSAMEKDKQRLLGEKDVFADKLAKELASAAELLESRKCIDKKLAAQEADLHKKVDIYTEMTAQLSAGAEEIDQQKNSIFELHHTVSTKTSEMNSLRSLQATLERREEQILSEKSESEGLSSSIIEQQSAADQEMQELRAALQDIAEQSEREQTDYNEALADERQVRKQLEELRVSIGQVSTRKKMIEEMENNYEGYNHAVKFIMKSDLLGISGVVAELIKTPEGFETAIETALGAGMQNIVCEDDQSAQAAIRLLKANKAGRLTFLPKKSIRAAGSNFGKSLAGEQGFKGVAAECISFDPQYGAIMNYLLGRVMIVDVLENAVRLSKKASGGLRFVTLGGEVINAGGAITGGAYRSSTANLLERRSEIGKLGEKLTGLTKQGKDCERKLAELKTIIEEGAAAMQRNSQNHRELELALLAKENELKMMSGQLEDMRTGEEKWKRELLSIEEEARSSGAMISELREAAEAAEAEIEAVKLKAENAMTAYESQKAELETISDAITKARIAAASAESEKANADQMAGRIEAYSRELSGEIETRVSQLSRIEGEKSNLLSGGEDLEVRLKEKEADKGALEKYLSELIEERTDATKKLQEITVKKESLDQLLTEQQTQKYELDIKLAKNETQLDNYKNKLWDEFEVSYLQAIEYKKREFDLGEAVKDSREIKSKIKSLGEVNTGAIKEYESVSERYEFLTVQRDDLLDAMNSLKQIIADMDKTIRANFKESFDRIAANFEDSFRQLFGGGTAELRLEDETDPLECGIEIVAQPPGKKLQNINLMSGGEKTMTAIALMFAVLKAKPTPFCILDEIEAALDDANIERFAKYLTNFHEIQFALVTHQKATMEYADVLYGVTMPEQGVSRILSLKFGDEIEL